MPGTLPPRSRALQQMMKALAKNARAAPLSEDEEEISAADADPLFREAVEALLRWLRRLVDEVRSYERSVMELCVRSPGCRAPIHQDLPATGGSPLGWPRRTGSQALQRGAGRLRRRS